MQNCASLAADRSRSAKEVAVMSPGDWAGNHVPQSALFPLLLSTDRRNGTLCFRACDHGFWLVFLWPSLR